MKRDTDGSDWLGAACLLVGAAAFLWGGAQHPSTDATMAAVGTAEYFRIFAEHVAAADNWEVIHTGILVGPLLWAMGIVSLGREAGAGPAAHWSRLGSHALGLGAVAWAVVFVLDGFVAPLHAEAVLESGNAAAVMAFRTNQEVVIRLGLVAWILIGVGIASSAVGTWSSSIRSLRAGSFAILGLCVGLWPLAAWSIGDFRPGPFTSGLWVPTAVLTSMWAGWAAVELAWPERASS